MKQNTVVIYQFSLKPGVTTDDLMQASQKVDALMLGRSGFMYRSLTLTERGLWQDIIYWEDLQAMQRGSDMENHTDFAALMDLIELESVRRSQAAVYSSAWPTMEEDLAAADVDDTDSKVA